MDHEPTGHDQSPDALPPHRRSPRNTGARTVLVILAVIAVIAGAWWIANALL